MSLMGERLIELKSELHNLRNLVIWARYSAMMEEDLEKRMKIAANILDEVEIKLAELAD
jgi:hypothetical protein